MEKIYRKLSEKVSRTFPQESKSLNGLFYKMLLNLIAFLIILTRNSGTAFSLVIQNKTQKLEVNSYQSFKAHQRNIRLIFLSIIIFLVIIFMQIKKS